LSLQNETFSRMVPVKYTVLYMDTSLLVFHERKKVKEINLKK